MKGIWSTGARISPRVRSWWHQPPWNLCMLKTNGNVDRLSLLCLNFPGLSQMAMSQKKSPCWNTSWPMPLFFFDIQSSASVISCRISEVTQGHS